MATQTLSAADAILKDMYVSPIVEQLNQKTYLIDQFERDSEHIDYTGRRAIFPLHTQRNRGRGGRGDGGTLPTAGRQEWQDAIIKITYQYGAIGITDASIEQSKSNQGAFISLLDAETKGCANDMRKDINRQAFGEGNGLLASVAVTMTTEKTLTLDSVQYIAVGDPVDVLVKSSGATGTGAVGTEVTAREGGATKTITLATTVTADKTFGVYISGDRNNETNGLRNIIKKNRTLHEINSETAGNQFWNGNVREAGTSASATAVAGESLFEQLADDVGFSGQGEVEVFLTSRGIKRRLADTYQSQKRFNDANTVDVHGGYTAIMVNDIPVVSDDDAVRNTVFGLNKASFRWFQLAAPGWMNAPDGNGGIFHLKDGTTAGTKVATYQAFFKWYCNLGCVAPNRNGVINFATDDNPS